MSGLNTERLVLSGGPIGLMQAAMDIALPYVRERKQFDAPIGTFGLMQGKIADMYTALQSSRAFAYQVARDFDARAQVAHGCGRVPAARVRSRGAGRAGGASRRWAATATSTSSRPGGSCATPSSTPSAPGTNEIRRMLIGRELFDGQDLNRPATSRFADDTFLKRNPPCLPHCSMRL